MRLCDRDIRYEMTTGLVITPVEDIQFQPASVDLRLGNELRTPDDGVLYRLTATGFVLQPFAFLLGDTLEYLEIPPYLSAELYGKSSLGRIGLQVHCTAGFVDPGFKGTLTLELSTLSEQGIVLRPGMPVGQLCIDQMSGPADRPYGHPELKSKYMSQSGPTLARE